MLLTEQEVAQRLRSSVARVRKLRLTGQLAYIRGRPVLVDEADLARFIEARRAKAGAGPARPGTPEYEIPVRDASLIAAERARRTLLLRRLRAAVREGSK